MGKRILVTGELDLSALTFAKNFFNEGNKVFCVGIFLPVDSKREYEYYKSIG